MNKNARWITNDKFASLTPNHKIYHKEKDKYTPEYNKDLLNSHILFRKKFNISDTEHSFRIHISADDYYRLYINGKFVCSGPAPSYPWNYYYNDVDISEYICKGKNTIAVHTYYQGLINRVWVSGDDQHGMICQIFADEQEILASDTTFKCATHTGFGVYDIAVKHNTIFNEIIDSNSEMIGFEEPDFDDTGWEYSSERKIYDYNLVKQPTPTLTYYDTIPKIIKPCKDGLYIDIGSEIVGYLNVFAKGQKDDTVIIRYSEELDNDNLPRYNLRCNCVYEDRWILSGKKDRFSHFDYKGFRYAQIIIPDGCQININDISVTVRHMPFECVKEFRISDAKLKRIWDLCKNTIKYGAQECFVDCPTREKGQYLGDVCISSVAYSILTGKTDMLKKSIESFACSSKICPGLMAVSTSSFMQEIADFSLLFPFIILWYHHLSKDVDFVKDMVPIITDMRSYFQKYERSDGLICNVTEKWNLVDWPENLRDGYDAKIERPIGDVCHNVLNAFYIGFLKCANVIYAITDDQKSIDTTKYEAAFINEFYNKEKFLFTDTNSTDHTALHSNVLPLLFNIGINDKTKEKIVDLIKQKGVSACGTYFSYFVLQALKNVGEKETVLNLIKDEKAWLNMLSEDATTTFEAWGKDQKWNTSLFHPWSTCPIIILYDM